MLRRVSVLALGCLLASGALAQDPVYSGPQPGEKAVPFKIRGALGDLAGKELDLVSQASGKPLVLVFVHRVTRPSVALTRLILDFAAQRRDAGLAGGLVYLAEDATEAEAALKRMAHALPTRVPIGISLDGAEGPGAYGLNRGVELTVLVIKDHVVHANFALVQPSVQADAPRIVKEVVAVSGGGKVPTLAELGAGPQGGPEGRMTAGGELQPLLRSLIQRQNDDRQVAEAVAAIEKLVAANPAARKELGEIARRIVNAGKVTNYGTPAAQQHLRTWSEKYGPKEEKGKDRG